jgi:hypothetical protein
MYNCQRQEAMRFTAAVLCALIALAVWSRACAESGTVAGDVPLILTDAQD